MNAVLREECEASVLTNEAIEVHLSYLRPAVEAIQAELPALRQEMKALEERLSNKFDQKIDKVDQKVDRVDQKVDKLADRITEMQVNLKGLILFLTTAGLIVSGVSIAHALNWL